MTAETQKISFKPPFCPNPNCPYHQGTGYTYYVKNGFAPTQKAPGFNQKFKCTVCQKGFSRNTFSIEFRKKKIGLGDEILFSCMNGMSNNSIAIKLGIAESTVRNRLTFLGRQALLFEKEKHVNLKIKEQVAYDGFETFTYDQFSPCYINTAVGSKSMYNYSATFSPMNRKGKMTEQQKEKQKKLILTYGYYPKSAIAKSSEYAFKLLESHSEGNLLLVTDEHKSYQRALKKINLDNILHMTVHSTLPRLTTNPLFPINHLHRNYRHFFSSQQRESIAFQKHEAALMDKIQLMKIYKNFMRTKFTRSSKSDPDAGKCSPAMYLNLEKEVLRFNQVFAIRKFVTHYQLDCEEKKFYERNYEFSRRKIALY